LNSTKGSVVVLRDDDLWVYPVGVAMKKPLVTGKEYFRSHSMFTNIPEPHDLKHGFSRRKSFDEEDLARVATEKTASHPKKQKKGKGLFHMIHRHVAVCLFLSDGRRNAMVSSPYQ
jgi:hypothetical protein